MARVALVTGGTRGIGAAIALGLQAAGYRVAVSYAGNEAAAAAFTAASGIKAERWDVGDYQACRAGVAAVEAAAGPIDVLVNNAGITRDVMLHKMTAEQWRQVMATNVDSLFAMTRSVIEGMRARKFGRIVNIGSVNGQRGQLGQANYAAAKAAAIGFTRAVALEGAAVGITCNCITPGYIATEMVQAVPEEVMRTRILPTIPVGRLGTPEEIARCVVFLAGDDAGFITGAVLAANGGQYMG